MKIASKIGSLLFIGWIFFSNVEAKTLGDFRGWAKNFQEAPAKDSSRDARMVNLTDPQFTTFYRSMEPGFFRWILSRLHILSRSWSPMELQDQLVRIAKKRPALSKRPAFKDIMVKKGTRAVFFGALYGSFFSFLRDLTELEKEGMITNDLVVADDTYLVILGDVVNFSPYSFQLLAVILELIEKNPERVIYLRGEQETDGYWENFSVMRYPLTRWAELWGSKKDREALPLKKELNGFFDTLPDYLMIRHETDKVPTLISSFQRPPDILTRPANVTCLIMGHLQDQFLWKTSGLYFSGFENGVATWSLISCPNRINQDFMDFFNDAFILVNFAETFTRSELHFIHRDVREKKDFIDDLYSLALGFSLAKGRDFIEYPVLSTGATMSLSGPVSTVGRGGKSGIEEGLLRINRNGGIQKHLIRPVIFNDSYIPRIARRNVSFLKDGYGINLLLAPQGTPTFEAYFDRVKNGDFYVFFPVTGGEQFRDPSFSHVIHLRQSYTREVRGLVDHVTNEYGSKRFAFIYQDDSFGLQLINAAHDQLKKQGITSWVDIPFQRDQLLLRDQVKKMVSSGADAIGFFFTSNSLARDFLEKIGGTFLKGKHLFAISFLDDPLFRQYLTSHGIKITFSYVFPNPHDKSIQIAREFLEEAELRHSPIDANGFEGFIAAMLFGDGLTHITPPFTGDKLMNYFESLQGYDFKGLKLTFHPETRSFDLPIWILTENNSWIEMK